MKIEFKNGVVLEITNPQLKQEILNVMFFEDMADIPVMKAKVKRAKSDGGGR